MRFDNEFNRVNPEPSLEELLHRLGAIERNKTALLREYYRRVACGDNEKGEALTLACQAMVILIDHARISTSDHKGE